MKAIPIEMMILNKMNHLKALYQKWLEAKASNKDTSAFAETEITDFHNNSTLTLDEYKFPHLISIMDVPLNDAALRSLYTKSYKNLELDDNKEAGLTIILTTKWMMVVPLTKPYATVRGKDMFVEPLAYAGFMNVQTMDEDWP